MVPGGEGLGKTPVLGKDNVMKSNLLSIALCVVLIGLGSNSLAAESEDIDQDKFVGIGVTISLAPSGVKVEYVEANKPAAEAGLKEGDIIIDIDSNSTKGMPFTEVLERIRGKAGTMVTLTISRGDIKPFTVEVKRDIISIPPKRKELMPYLFKWGTFFFWPICYLAIIWICLLGKKKNPNRAWNLLITGEIMFLLMYIPAIYLKWYANKISYSSQLNISAYFRYIGQGVILPLAMIIFIIGLYRIATNKK